MKAGPGRRPAELGKDEDMLGAASMRAFLLDLETLKAPLALFRLHNKLEEEEVADPRMASRRGFVPNIQLLFLTCIYLYLVTLSYALQIEPWFEFLMDLTLLTGRALLRPLRAAFVCYQYHQLPRLARLASDLDRL